MREETIAPGVNLLESIRSVGYSFSSALADLIDNSITANASIIDIDADVLDSAYVAILDNGEGMSPSIAKEALRLAGKTGQRSKGDLGRFGLGLKTASLSQARRVTVVTRKDSVTTALRWDLDHVLDTGRWALLLLSSSEVTSLPLSGELERHGHGTLVVWENLDLLLGDAMSPGEYLRGELVSAMESLSLVFHRYLRGIEQLTIRMNGLALEPIDPFLEANPRTQISPTEEVRIQDGIVEVTAFTLPHPSGLTPAERSRIDLTSGMREAQGFYVYRNRRLISHGSWFGLAAKSELTKQTRIRVDIPNSLDHLWQLDIKKSRVEPPASFKSHLKRLIDPLLERGRRVHTFRGRRNTDLDLTRIWDRVSQRGSHISYQVNSEHPVLVAFRDSLADDQARMFDSVLVMISSGFPSHDLYASMASSSLVIEDEPAEKEILDKLVLLKEAGALGETPAEATARLSAVEPFNRIKNLDELVQQLVGSDTNGI